MTSAETLTLASYFFVLIILAVYGWHRYYLVYLYLRNRGKEPEPGATLSPQPVVTIQLPLYNEMYVADRLIASVCAIEYPRELLEIQVLDDSTDETRGHRRSRSPAICRRRDRHQVPSPDRSHRLQGGRARSRAETGARRVRRHFRRRFPSDVRLSHAPHAAVCRPEGRHGAGALGTHQPGLLAAHEDSVDPARRSLRARARRPLSGRTVLQFQRHGGGVARASRSPTPADGSTTR